jgi:O-antigen/teichoic acid export membrane protein
MRADRCMNVPALIVSRVRWIAAAKSSASAVAHSLVSRVSILVINVATGIIVARTLGPAGRGIAAAIALWPPMLSGLLTLGVPAALQYEVRRNVDRPSALFSSALLISALLGLLAFAAGLLLLPHVMVHYPAPVVSFSLWMMAFAPLIVCNATLQAFYQACGDFKRANAMIYVPSSLTLAALMLLYAAGRLSPYSVALVYELPFALTTFAALASLRHLLRLPRNLPERIRSLVHYGTRAYGIDILNTLGNQIDQAMVVGLLSEASFGLYAVALSGSRVLSVAGNSLNTVLTPAASSLDPAEAVALVSRSARIVFAVTLLAALAFVAALPVLVPLAFGEQYDSIVGITRLLTIAVVFGATTGTLTQAFMATGRPEIATILQCAGLCLTIPLMLLLIPRLGLTGAAYALDISNALRFAFVLASYPLILHHRVPRIVPTRQDIRDALGRLQRLTSS